jgi:hypothetical protein
MKRELSRAARLYSVNSERLNPTSSESGGHRGSVIIAEILTPTKYRVKKTLHLKSRYMNALSFQVGAFKETVIF